VIAMEGKAGWMAGVVQVPLPGIMQLQPGFNGIKAEPHRLFS